VAPVIKIDFPARRNCSSPSDSSRGVPAPTVWLPSAVLKCGTAVSFEWTLTLAPAAGQDRITIRRNPSADY
jgi:hypothetical protein